MVLWTEFQGVEHIQIVDERTCEIATPDPEFDT